MKKIIAIATLATMLSIGTAFAQSAVEELAEYKAKKELEELKAAEAAKAKAEAEEKKRAEEEARRKANEEARRKAEEKRQACNNECDAIFKSCYSITSNPRWDHTDTETEGFCRSKVSDCKRNNCQ